MLTNRQIDKYVDGCNRGLMTASEFASSFVYDIASSDNRELIASLFARLPESLQHAVDERFAELKEQDFRWKPLLFGAVLSDGELERLRDQLSLAYETLIKLRN